MNNRGSNIVLIGFMGSGKTTTGLKLSYKLHMPVEDTDRLIEKKQGISISEIFAQDGEEAFRRMETELLRDIVGRKYGRILSVGGGMPVREENRALLKQCGKVFYLRAKAETIYDRIKEDTTRPLLQCADPLSKIQELLAERSEAYEKCADVILDVDGLPVYKVVEIYRTDRNEKRKAREYGNKNQDDKAAGDQRTESQFPRDPGEKCLWHAGLPVSVGSDRAESESVRLPDPGVPVQP